MSSMINVNFHPSLVYLIPFSHVGTNNTYSYFMTNRTSIVDQLSTKEAHPLEAVTFLYSRILVVGL
jgi:hypothetical protein